MIVELLLVQAMTQDAGPGRYWDFRGPLTGTYLVDPDGSVQGTDRQGRTWSERDGIIQRSNGSGCSTRNGVTFCW